MTDPTEVKAMRLWSDWNVGSALWSQRHGGDVGYDYLRIRTEDLVNPETKNDVYHQVGVKHRC